MTTQRYKIEGNYDFYSALNAPDQPPESDDGNICLITRMPLTDDHVVMECGHKFNYLPLYNGLVQNNKQIMANVRSGQISCPFCRNFQTTLLPFNPNFNKVVGVNLYPYKINKDCGILCQNVGHLCKLANLNECTSDHGYNVNNNYYCEAHHILGVSIERQKTNHEAFLLKKQNADIKKAAAAAREAKKKENEKTMKNKIVNQIVTTINPPCIAILKSGPRKGQPCMCMKTVDNGFCKRHSK